MIDEKIVSKGKRLKCQRCKKEWVYKGQHQWFTSCPNCKTSVSVRQRVEVE